MRMFDYRSGYVTSSGMYFDVLSKVIVPIITEKNKVSEKPEAFINYIWDKVSKNGPGKFFLKCCLPRNLLGTFLNTYSHIFFRKFPKAYLGHFQTSTIEFH